MLSLDTEFPEVAGIIDGTQIPIAAHYIHPEQDVNRNGVFALNCQVIINHRGALTHMSCRWPGSLHNSRVLQESCMQEVLDRSMLGLYYLLGDRRYACQRNLLTPYNIPRNDKEM